VLVDQAIRGESFHGFLRRAALLHAADPNAGPLDGMDSPCAHAAHDDDLAVVQESGEGPVIMPV